MYQQIGSVSKIHLYPTIPYVDNSDLQGQLAVPLLLLTSVLHDFLFQKYFWQICMQMHPRVRLQNRLLLVFCPDF